MGGMDTTMLFTVALQLADPWKVIDVSFRDAAGSKREPRITVGYGPGSRVHCPEAKCREGVMPGSRHGGTHVAPFGLLPVQGLHPRARAARGLSGPWRQDGSDVVGEARQWVHAPVRGHGRRTRRDAAGGGRRGAGRRARHEAVAVHLPLRGRGQALRGLHGRGGHRHRWDRPQRPRAHHRGRRPGGAQRGLRGARQGLEHRQGVRAGLHGPQR